MYTRLNHNHCFHGVCASLVKEGQSSFFQPKIQGRESEEAHSKSEEAFEAKTKVRRQVPPLPQ